MPVQWVWLITVRSLQLWTSADAERTLEVWVCITLQSKELQALVSGDSPLKPQILNLPTFSPGQEPNLSAKRNSHREPFLFPYENKYLQKVKQKDRG